MKQFVLPATYAGDGELTVSGRDFHYLHRVRRFSEGDTFPGRSRDGVPYQLTVAEVGSNTMRLLARPAARDAGADGVSAGSAASSDAATTPDIVLYQCLPKARTLDQIVRQTVEAGVSRIVPVASRRTVKRLDGGEGSQRKLERWRRIAEEAVQQSGRSTVPAVDPVRDLPELPLVGAEDGEVGLLFHEKALADHGIGSYLSAGPRRVTIVIGPEGGLSDEEVNILVRRGFNPVSLGPNVLRTETAAIYAIAAVQSVYRELVAWKQ
jgi:16S rRNA (uracil1498-N3)-methyltransferase